MLTMLCCVLPAHAQTSLKTLLMPGKLAQAHAKLESDCNQCHVSFAKEAQDDLCLTCHEAVADDIGGKQGFHGQLFAQAGKPPACRQCHTDHEGRDADIVGLDRDRFPHDRTDFPLRGAHASADCAACHVDGKKFREAPQQCVGCHQQDDPHRGELGRQCDSCHDASNWKQTRFDHDTKKFSLQGAHRKVQCASCHPMQRYRETPDTCIGCHAINDVHRGSRGNECQRCHQQTDWKAPRFDHAGETGFALRGAHAKQACDSCHRQGNFDTRLGTACIDCHRGSDIHNGRNGTDCKSCHAETRWKQSRFDHDRDTHFPLRGGHRTLSCDSCHRGTLGTTSLSGECHACHGDRDPHQGQLGERCQQCHTEKGWREGVAFDHALTAFPLLGMHALQPCESCHLDGRFKDAAADCRSCHAADDPHRRQLGDNCQRCHNPGGWNHWQFDHDAATDFPLTGKHRDVACNACHSRPLNELKRDDSCYACHAGDDRHRGQFGRQCAQCHNTDAFDRVQLR